MLPFKSKFFLFPYWITLKIRHFLYDKNIKEVEEFPIPIISVGNITVGGTGKTPHTELLIRLLQNKERVAVLSRGYKRKTKGFRIASAEDTYKTIGDEPLQIKQKFPNIIVAVCANRREGIKKLLALPTEGEGTLKPTIIILDDAFQHRHVKPSHSIVLTNYNNPIFKDNLLPIGTLRDLPEQIKRANTVIITKSPLFGEHDGIIDDVLAKEQIIPQEKEWRKNLKLKDNQNLLFSVITYGEPIMLSAEADTRYLYSESAIFFTGIANDDEFKNHILGKYKVLDSKKFADHCNFSKGDIKGINSWAKSHPRSAIFTTEKDSKRLINNPYLSEDVKKRLFYIPIEVRIIPAGDAAKILGK